MSAPFRYLKTILLSLLCLHQLLAASQNTLPEFNVHDIGNNRYVISWVNNYAYTAQITIQRSFDSLSGYKSILSVPDPNSRQNGYADSKAVNDHMFYRLYILLDNGKFLFTKAKKPVRDTTEAAVSTAPAKAPTEPVPAKGEIKQLPGTVEKTGNQVAATQVTGTAPANQLTHGAIRSNTALTSNTAKEIPKTAVTQEISSAKKEPQSEDTEAKSNSVPLPVDQLIKAAPVVIRLDNIKTGDSAKTPATVVLQGEPNAYAPSLYVYTHPDGNIRIQVPNRSRLARYRIRFYEPDRSFLFELKNLPAPYFQLDKTNFLHSGWFHFELYEDNRIIEKHKLYLE